MFDPRTRIAQMHASRSGGNTIVLELWDDAGQYWTITSASSPEEQDYGCLYFNDQTPMSRNEELALLGALEAYLAAGRADGASEDLRLLRDLIKQKGQ